MESNLSEPATSKSILGNAMDGCEQNHIPIYKRDEYRSIIEYFSNGCYEKALLRFNELLPKDNKYLTDDEEKYDNYDLCILWGRIANCHYGILEGLTTSEIITKSITTNASISDSCTACNSREFEHCKKFFDAIKNYLTFLLKTELYQPKSLGKERRDTKELLKEAIELRLRFREAIEKPIKFDELQLKDSITKDLKRFISIKWFGYEHALSVLTEKLFEERRNFNRSSNLADTRILAEIYLDLTKSDVASQCIISADCPVNINYSNQISCLDKNKFNNGRAQVMNLLSDLAYFQKDEKGEEEALQWAEKCLEINPKDRFALAQKKFIQERQTVQNQIRRFEHDTNSAIAGIVNNLNLIMAIPDKNSSDVQSKLKTIKLELDRIETVNRFVANKAANFKDIEPLQYIKQLAEKYLEYATINIENSSKADAPNFDDPNLKWDTDIDYLCLALDNILKNSKEAFERNIIPKSERRVVVRVDLKEEQITITDNAGGIAPKISSRIFEPYVSTKGIEQKSGLGLSQARLAIEKLGGTIKLTQDQPVNGACFEIKLNN